VIPWRHEYVVEAVDIDQAEARILAQAEGDVPNGWEMWVPVIIGAEAAQ
jgi:hypothetical protein